jgi:hypothetical protein
MNVAYSFSPKTASKGLAYSLPKSRASMSSPQVHYKAQRIPITPIIGMRLDVFLLMGILFVLMFLFRAATAQLSILGSFGASRLLYHRNIIKKRGVSGEEEFKSSLFGFFIFSCVVVSSLCGCCL